MLWRVFTFLILIFPGVVFGASLKVATYNLGMLDVVNSVPFFKERQELLKDEMGKVLRDTGVDVLALQEMWTDESLEALKGAHSGYEVLSTGGDAWIPFVLDHPTGMSFLVKKSLNGKVAFYDFAKGEGRSCGYGQICDKGMLVFTFNKAGKKVAVINSHLTSSWKYRDLRRSQLLEIKIFMESLLLKKGYDFAILAGDLNYSPTFGNFRKGDQGEKKHFEYNAKLYNLFFTLGDSISCEDTFKSASEKPNFKYTYNRDTNLLVLKVPESSYEPSQRVDHVFICGRSISWKVPKTVHMFEKPVSHFRLSYPIHLSDHYGVLSVLEY